EQRQVDVGEIRADQPLAAAAAIARENVLEPAQIFGEPLRDEIARAALGCRFLIFVVEAACDRMMRVVSLADEVGDGELNLTHLAAVGGVLGAEAEVRRQERENVR